MRFPVGIKKMNPNRNTFWIPSYLMLDIGVLDNAMLDIVIPEFGAT